MFERKKRPLTSNERKLLEGRLKRIEKQWRGGGRWIIVFGLCIFGPLWLLTVIVVKDLSTLWLSVFWVISATLTCLWASFSAARDIRKQRQVVEKDLQQNSAEEVVISSSEMVEFEEIEDLGDLLATTSQVQPPKAQKVADFV